MWNKIKDQLPSIVLTAALVMGIVGYMVHQIAVRQRAELVPLREQNESLRLQAEENRRQIEATTKLIKEVIAQNSSGTFRSEDQIEKLSDERITRLADVIAKRVIPAVPAAKSAEEVEQNQNEQVDKVAGRLAENIRPLLASAVADQKAAAAEDARNSEARVQQLNLGLLAAQAAAQDALRLSHEISALYVESFRDQGILMRLFSLPANIMIDAANLNLVTGDRKKVERELAQKMDEVEKRLKEVRTMAVAGGS